LKFILDQRLTTISQHTWVSKLFGYDFSVEYRQGKLNAVADALSRCHKEILGMHTISSPSFTVFDSLRNELTTNTETLQLRVALAADTTPPGWSDIDDLLLFKWRALLPTESFPLAASSGAVPYHGA
jgi:hypothetical protein